MEEDVKREFTMEEDVKRGMSKHTSSSIVFTMEEDVKREDENCLL
jgi:hypothetical protein